MKTLFLNDKLSFGKYKNYTLKYIAQIDWQYLIWLHNSYLKYTLSEEVLRFLGLWNNYKNFKQN